MMDGRTKYGFTSVMADAIRKSSVSKVFFNIAAGLCGSYCGLMAVLTLYAFEISDVEDFLNYGGDLEFLCGITIGSLIGAFIVAIVGDQLVKKGKGGKAASVYFVFVIVMALPSFTLLSDVYDEDAIFCQVLSVMVMIMVMVFVIIGLAKTTSAQSEADVIINNLQKSSFEIRENYICGVCFDNVTRSGDGRYYELPFSEIRNVRTTWFNADTRNYFTLMIDHTRGTMNFCIGSENLAYRQLRRAMEEAQNTAATPVAPVAPAATVTPVAPVAPAATVTPVAPVAPAAPVTQWICTECGQETSTAYCSRCGANQEKMLTLTRWLNDGLITRAEYDVKAREIRGE